jgi:GNAT superfamily N-acetyltransferase
VALSRPELLADHHDLESFASGESSLDEWLRRRARVNQLSGASRTYVVNDGDRVAGYYALASGAVATDVVTGRFRRNMPDPIPVVILGRLAVDRAWQGRGLGRGLFRDAAQRVVQAADTIGIRGILVHAISGQARNFYLALGFDECPGQPMMLVVTLADLRAALA